MKIEIDLKGGCLNCRFRVSNSSQFYDGCTLLNEELLKPDEDAGWLTDGDIYWNCPFIGGSNEVILIDNI